MSALEVIFLVIFWSWLCSAALFLRNTIVPRLPITQTPQAYGLSAETVQFPSTDGVQLEGWKIVRDPELPWIIMCHGLVSNRADLLEIAAGLAPRFNLLLFDFRGHGGSRGRSTSFGWTERYDLQGALAFLGQQPDVRARPYGAYGISMGGAVALLVAADDERLGAVVADSPYATLQQSLARHLKLLYPVLPSVPFVWYMASTYRLRFGVWPSHVSPERAIGSLGKRPLLLIHGGQDLRMPLADSQRLLDNSLESQSKELWVVPEAGHLEAFAVNPPSYLNRLTDFFTALDR